MEVNEVIRSPTGIEATIKQRLGEEGDKADPKTAMATLSRSYEQAHMQVILEDERDQNDAKPRSHFKVVRWIRDGVYVHFRRKG